MACPRASLKSTVPCPLASKYVPRSKCAALWCRNLTPVLAKLTFTPRERRYAASPCGKMGQSSRQSFGFGTKLLRRQGLERPMQGMVWLWGTCGGAVGIGGLHDGAAPVARQPALAHLLAQEVGAQRGDLVPVQQVEPTYDSGSHTHWYICH